ncbi:PAAR-like protein [Empedobacter sedimenti]|uniref:PAAR-like protein n=1 Tax=Empedobacter sedimenti TaxID=3042610 RepID=UPI0024A6B064|nr:PAAR-like protein [Empedobacter sedimenti]
MSKLYVPDGAWLVCSDGMKKQQIKVTSQTTVTIAGGYLKATVDDRPGGNFMCAKMVIGGAVIGALVGVALVAGSVVTGGGLAVAAIAAAGAAAGAGVSMIPSICGMLLKEWTPYDVNVLTVSKHPLLDNSMIPCYLGGSVSILYSEKAADEFTDKVLGETILTVGAIVCIGYVAGGLIAAVGAAGTSLMSTFAEYGFASAAAQATGMASVFGTSLLVNSVYDEIKDVTGVENYVTGKAYDLNTKGENEAMIEATDKVYGATTDALDSGNGIANRQTSIYQSTTINNTNMTHNGAYVVDGNGNITKPGTTFSSTTLSTSNQLPNSSIGRSQTQVAQSNLNIRMTPNTLEISSRNSLSVYGSQYNNSLRTNVTSGLKESFGGGVIFPKNRTV